jgi:ABC-type sugar transport system substrate-binding protein
VLQRALKVKAGMSRARVWVPVVAVAASLLLVACGGSKSSSATTAGGGSGRTASKLIVADVAFPCGLNDYAKSLCAGFADVKRYLPPGFTLQLKTAINFADTTAFNNLIQTSQQLNPGGLIVFPDGPAAQVPVLKQACARGIKIIIIDNPVTGLGGCQSSFLAANNEQLGVNVGKWLLAHPPSSKDVGIVTFPPGQTASTDARVKGFTKTVEAAGYRVVATVNTDLTLDKTRTGVTNMLTAHPSLGAIFSTVDSIGDGTAQAVGRRKVVQLTVDGALSSVKRIPGGLSADAAQDPYWLAKQSVLTMVRVLQGQKVAPLSYEPTQVVDQTNVKAYIAAGGLH